MATFKFVGRDIDIHWNGYDIVGPAETVFSIPDQLYEEFEGDIRGVEPSLTWIDTNEFQTLTNNVSTANLSASLPLALTTTTSGKTISLSSTTALNGYLLAADGTGGTIWTPASTSSLTSVIGVSPISTVISGGTVSVSLSANYQTAGSYQPAGTYVTGVVGTSPISATGTTAITVSLNANYQTAGNYASSVSATLPISASISTAGAVSISIDTTGFQSAGSYQTSGTYVNAVIGTSPASVSTTSGTSTVSIIAASINSTHLADNAVVAAKIAAAAVGTAAISSGSASSGLVLAANGIGGVAFTTAAAGFNGPVSSIDETITRFDGTGGTTVQGSSVVINDSNDVFFPAAIAHSPVSVSLSSNTYTLDLSTANYFTGVTAGTRIAPTFVSSSSVNFAAATSGVLTLPTGIQANDIVVALIGSDEGSAIANSSTRWTLVTRIKGGTGFANGAIFQATITSSAETSIGTFTGLVTASNGIAYALRGCGGYARIATSTGTVGMPDPPSLTAEFLNTVILAIGFLDDDAVLPTAPAGYVNLASVTSSAGFTTMIAMNTITAGGAQNPAAFGGAGTDDWAAATMEMYGILGTRSVVLSNPPDRAISGYLNAKAHTVVISYTGVAEGTLSWDTKITWAANATPPGSADALVVLTSNDGVTYRGNYTAY